MTAITQALAEFDSLVTRWLFDDGYLTGRPEIDEPTIHWASAKRQCAQQLQEKIDALRARQPKAVPDAAAKHWHDMYRKECQLRQDDAARYGQEIVDLEAALPHRAPAAGGEVVAGEVEPPQYSIDADPLGIRERAAAAITGALGFGAQGVNPPPEGHWLTQFWQMARADAELQLNQLAPAGVGGLAALRAEQAEAVMPLIGPLLDAWERAHADDLVGESGLLERLAEINAAMNDPATALAAAQQEPRDVQ